MVLFFKTKFYLFFPVSAPFGFSFACIEEINFLDPFGAVSLKLKKMQVQPWINDMKFDQPYDCVGILTPGIASGIFVTFLLLTILSIGITAILDIKTPKRFENQKSKPLTFYIKDK